MIISFKNINGGGGGGYVLPTATPTRLGGVKIGQGINVDSAGTISVSGSDVANYAMALKNIQEGDEDNYKVVNEGGWLYYIEDFKSVEENIFVKVKYDADVVSVDMDIDGQNDTDIVEIGNGDFTFTISIDSEDNLYYVNENDEEVYHNSEALEYQYGDFTFIWLPDGKHIEFFQQVNKIEVNVLTENCEMWYCVGQEINIASQSQLGLVKIGEGIDLAEDGTISVAGGGDSTKLISVSELPTGATEGDVVSLFKENENESYCYIEANGEVKTSTFNFDGGSEGGTINIHTGNILPSENLLILTVEYWGYNNIYLTSAGTYVLDGGITGDVPIDIQPSGWTRDEDTNYFSVMPTEYGLDLTFKNERTVEVHYSLPIETKIVSNMYVWDTLSPTCKINRIYENSRMPETIIISWFGDLPINEPLIKMHSNDWDEDFYMAFDGNSFPMYRDSGLTSYWANFAEIGVTTGGLGWAHISTASEGLIVYTLTELNVSFEMLGDWFEAGNGHWKPIDYESIVNNAIQSITKTKTAQVSIPGVGGFTTTVLDSQSMGITFYAPSNGGTKGQIMQSNGDGQAPVWTDFKPIKVLDTLPVYANEGDIVIVSPFSDVDNNSFVSRNSTSDPNNFNFDEELGHTGEGHYLCFVNDGYDYTNNPNKTLIAVIQMRTDESWEWNNNHIEEAYIYFNSEDDGNGNWVQYYSLEYDFMKTIGGEPVQFSGQYTVDDTNTTVDSDWLNIWNDNYGYKFNLEYVEGAAQSYLYFRSVHSSGEGEDSGDVWVRIHYYTKQFKSGVSENSEPSEFYIFKNGIWIKLGKTEEPQV